MGFKRLFRFMSVAFIGGLGLFNSTKLEIRQITDTNAELIFQNGQIISSAIVCLSLAGFLSELVLMRKGSRDSNSESETIDLITYDDYLSAQEFYAKYAGDTPISSDAVKESLKFQYSDLSFSETSSEEE